MPVNKLKLKAAQQTDRGQVRGHNEDAIWPPARGFEPGNRLLDNLFIVADGMGGHRAGDVASQLVVKTICQVYTQSNLPADRRLEQAIEQANQLICQENTRQTEGTMGSTVVCVAVEQGQLYLANLGDSHAYLIRRGQIRCLSEDHSFVGELVQAGLLTPEQARFHSQRHVLNRHLGKSAEAEAYFHQEVLQPDDIVVLCSDGLHGTMAEKEIQDIATTYPPQQAVEQLVKLANERGGPDNISVIVIKAVSGQVDQPVISPEMSKQVNRPIRQPRLAWVLGFALFILAGVTFLLSQFNLIVPNSVEIVAITPDTQLLLTTHPTPALLALTPQLPITPTKTAAPSYPSPTLEVHSTDTTATPVSGVATLSTRGTKTLTVLAPTSLLTNTPTLSPTYTLQATAAARVTALLFTSTPPPAPTYTPTLPPATDTSTPPPSPDSTLVPSPTNIPTIPPAAPTGTASPPPANTPSAPPSPDETIITSTVISTSTFKYPAPLLWEPKNGGVIAGQYSAILKWEPVGPLAEDEWYAVRLVFAQSGQDVYRGNQVKEPQWAVPETFYNQADGPALQYRWHVFIERRETDGTNTQISPQSEIFVFRWE